MTAVPEIRFPGFMEKWNNVKLGEIVASIDAGWSPQCHEWPREGGGWGSLKTSSVTWSGFDPASNKALPDKLKPRPKLQVEHDDILITRAGPISRVGVVAHVTAPPSRLMISDKLIRIRVKQDRAAAEFVGISLGGHRAQSFLSARKSGLAEAQANISQQIARSVPVALPTLPEQQKIAAFLGAVDDKIDALRRKHGGLKQFKAGLMQKLFSQELRFKRDDGSDFPDWEQKRLGDAVKINPKSGKLPEVFEYIDLESVTDGVLAGTRKIAAIDAPSRAQRVLRRDDILFQTVRPYQRNNLFFNLVGEYVASTGYALLRCKHVPQYIFQVIHTNRFVDNVLARCTGTSYPAINSNDLAEVPVPYPHHDEQQKIADYLSAMDAKIEAVDGQITQMEAFKKGLLQKMFV